jgi:flagella basal body P-ring formation protein FlgA
MKIKHTTVMHALAFSVLTIGASVGHADSITLRSSVRMPANGTPLLLRHIAKLDGEAAITCGEMIIDTELDSQEPVEIGVDEIRALLVEHGVNWAQVSLTGSVLIVRPRVTSDAVLAMNAPIFGAVSQKSNGSSRATEDGLLIESQGFVSVETRVGTTGVKGKIISAIQSHWDARKGPLFVRIEDGGLAKIPNDAIDHVIRLRGTPRDTDWVDVEIRSLRDTRGIRPTKTILVRVDLRVRADVPIAVERMSSRHVLSRKDMENASRLVRPSDAARLLRAADLSGRKLAKPLQPGEILLWSVLEPEIVISRNDSVRVVMDGAFNLSGTDAYALERGAIGDRIKCRWRAGDQPFTALVVAAGEVRAGG